ncbi:MAG: Rho termination factor N-terminal domain-containing protein, partial [Crocinitomicaceae bacterium]
MDRKTLESKKISDLRTIAQTLGLENFESLKKPEIINKIMGEDASTTPVVEVAEGIEKTQKVVKEPRTERVERKPRIRQVVEEAKADETKKDVTENTIVDSVDLDAPKEVKKPVH